MLELFSVQYLFSFISINMLVYVPGFNCMAVGCIIALTLGYQILFDVA